MKVLAIDLGGTHANCAIVEDKQVVRSQLVLTSGRRRLEFTLPEFSKTLRALTAVEMMDLDDFAGIAIGFCGLIDGRLLTGKHFQAGCLGGHFPVRLEGTRCTCGAVRCAESEAAGYAWTGWRKVKVSAAQLGNNAALLGAVPLIAQGNRSRVNVR